MFPILYERGNLDGNGKGKLDEALSCVVSETLNGEYLLTIQYPVTGRFINELKTGTNNGSGVIGVICPSGYVDSGDFVNAFRVAYFDLFKYEVTLEGIVTFYANHVSRRMGGYAYYDTAIKGSLSAMVGKALPTPDLTLYNTDDGNPAWSSNTDSTPKSLLSCAIGDTDSMSSIWGFEFAFFGDKNVWQFSHRGADRGATIRYGQNLTALTDTNDRTEAFNAILPYAVKSDGTKLYYTNPGGDPQIVTPTTPITPIYAIPYDFSDVVNADTADPTELVSAARNLLSAQTPWNPVNTLEADFINGSEIDPHAPDVWLGDTVSVYWKEAKISTQMRVTAYEYDALAEHYNTMTLGAKQTEFVATTGGGYSAPSASGGGSGADYVTETGTSGMWTYRKWASGLAECWGASEVTVTSTTTWSNPIQYYATPVQKALPSGLFTSVQTCDAQVGSIAGETASDFWLTSASGYPLTTTYTQGVYLVRVNSASNKQVVIYWHVRGRWS